MTDMKTSADVVIIGGGIAGCAIAYHLAKKGCSNVVLLEKNHLANGSTGRCPGGIRTILTSEIKIQLARASLEMWKGLQQETQYEHDLELNLGGFLNLAYTPEQVTEFKQVVAFQRNMGVQVDFLSPEEAKNLLPMLSIKGLLAVTYQRDAGTINPHLATEAFAWASQRLGVSIFRNTNVTAITTNRSKVTNVVTDKGVIKTTKVVNAAGLGVGEIGKMVGIDVPFSVEHTENWITEPLNHILNPLVISWEEPNFVCNQRQSGNLFMGGVIPDISESGKYDVLWQHLFKLNPVIIKSFPAFKKVNIIRQWSGLLPISPDNHPILGEVEQIDGFYMAGTVCGQGFQLSPIIGKLMAEVILGEKPSISIKELHLERFGKGMLLKSYGKM
jgi:sarcosine oxidase subunit beta